MAANAPAKGNGGGDGGGGDGQIIPYNERFQRFGGFLARMKGQLQRALPKHIPADRMIRIILTTVQRTPELLECTPESMLGAILQCSQLGLEPDGVLGHAYLIPFNNQRANRKEVQLIVGYKGLLKLAYQSGEVGAIRARAVREKDRFSYSYGINETLVHEPYRGADPGPLVAVYAVAKIRGIDEPQFLVLEKWEIDAIRARSKASNNGPWVTDYEEMAKKSALRRECKLLPASTDKDNLARAIALDELAEAGVPQDLAIIDVEAQPASAGSGEDEKKAEPAGAQAQPVQPKLAAEPVDDGWGTVEPTTHASTSKLDALAATVKARRETR